MAKKRRQQKRSDRMASKGHPNPIDIHVGARIRARRTMLGLSQTALGDRLGLTFQQVHKYELGVNRVTSSRLFDLARVLDVNMAYFFDDMGSGVANQSPAALRGRVPGTVELKQDPAVKVETLVLVRAYYGIANRQVRMQLTNMIRAIAADDETGLPQHR